MADPSDRFADYDLFQLACAHFQEFQLRVAYEVRDALQAISRDDPLLVEIGCNAGYTTKGVLEQLVRSSLKARIIALDNDAEVFPLAQNHLAGAAHESGVTFVVEPAERYFRVRARELPESIDGCYSAWTLHNIDGPVRLELLKDIYRSLRPGSSFVNGDKYAHDDAAEHKRAYDWQLGQFTQAFARIGRQDLVSQWHSHYAQDDAPGYRWTEGTAKRELESIGFVDVRTAYRQQMEAVIIARKPSPAITPEMR